MYFPRSSIFGIHTYSQTTTSEVCPSASAPTFSVEIILSPADPEIVDFDKVVAAAAAVDAARTEQARADAYIAKVVADGIVAKIAADTGTDGTDETG